jgi:hypothetical protein
MTYMAPAHAALPCGKARNDGDQAPGDTPVSGMHRTLEELGSNLTRSPGRDKLPNWRPNW